MRRCAAVCVAMLLISRADAQEKFDAKDATKTAAWLGELWEPIATATKNKNAIARKSSEMAMDAALTRLMVGRPIDWTLPINGIVKGRGKSPVKEGVTFQEIPVANAGKFAVAIEPFLQKKDKTATGARPFAIENSEWVRELKPGESVRIQGIVFAAERSPGPRLKIIFAAYRLLPAEKK